MDNSLFPARSTFSRFARAAAVALIALSSNACSDSLRTLGSTPALAENHGSQVLEALSARFSPNDLTPRYDVARIRLAQGALTPSKIFNDTSVWDARPTPNSRSIYIAGGLIEGGKYRLETRPSLSAPTKLGDTRHSVTLEQLTQIDESVYRWNTIVDLAVGSVTAEEISLLVSALLAAGEGRSETQLRDDYRAAFPRAAAAFGRGFVVDSIHTTTAALGTTAVVLSVSFHPELMKPAFPALANYLDKYLGPAKYHFAFADRASGAALFDLVGQDRRITLRYRVQDGKLTSLYGPPRAWPDTVQMTSDVSLKVKIFTVGFKQLVTDFVISNTGHERAWTIVARKEPKWSLPLFTESLIRSPLRRPFEGEGSMFRLQVHDSAGTQSLFARHVRLYVQESTIMRFLGGLASHAIGELDTKVEAEEDRFLRDGMLGLQSDLRALVPRWK